MISLVDFLYNSIQFKSKSCMIQRSWFDANINLISYTHWQLFLLQIHPGYIIVCLIHTSDGIIFVCQIISYVIETNLWYQHLVKTSTPKLEISKFVHFAENFQKNIITTLKLKFFIFLAFFQSVLVLSY